MDFFGGLALGLITVNEMNLVLVMQDLIFLLTLDEG